MAAAQDIRRKLLDQAQRAVSAGPAGSGFRLL